jgi:hypothetical protein
VGQACRTACREAIVGRATGLAVRLPAVTWPLSWPTRRLARRTAGRPERRRHSPRSSKPSAPTRSPDQDDRWAGPCRPSVQAVGSRGEVPAEQEQRGQSLLPIEGGQTKIRIRNEDRLRSERSTGRGKRRDAKSVGRRRATCCSPLVWPSSGAGSFRSLSSHSCRSAQLCPWSPLSEASATEPGD